MSEDYVTAILDQFSLRSLRSLRFEVCVGEEREKTSDISRGYGGAMCAQSPGESLLRLTAERAGGEEASGVPTAR